MPTPIPWRKSTFSSGTNSCVEMSRDAEGHIFVRNSIHPDAGTLVFTSNEIVAFLAGAAAGEFDDFA